MEEITQYFKRKDRKTSSESSEGATPEEKRTKLSQANNMPTPSDMAEGVEGVLPKLQLVLDKLVSLETKVDSINKHVCSIDAKVLQLQNKVTTLESSVKENTKTVNEMEAGVTALNADVEEIKAKADKTSNEVITLRQQQWYLETYQRRENLRFYGIPERLDEQENTREVLVNFMINELNLEDAPQIEFQRETYSTKEIENQWRKQWRGELFFSHGTSRSKGVLVLVRENLDFKVYSTHTDDSGRFVILDTLIQDSPFLLANIYAPTKGSEQCQFLDEIANHFADKVCQSKHYVITGGDFNATFDPDLDCSGGRPSIKNCIKNLNDIMLQNDLVDIWRVRNPNKKRFTWRQKNPLIQRRLDFWLISNSLQDDIENVDILSSVKSDHSAIILNIDSVKNLNHGPSFWKFNNSLLDDEQYIKLIEQLVPDWIEEIKYSDDARVQWDWLKYNIRKETITYSKAKAKERREKIKRIEHKLKIAEEKLADSPNDDTQNEIDTLKSAYEKEYEYITKGAIIRSRATWYEKGEKNNKYFLNLQNNKKTKSTIRKLERKNSNITVDPNCIMDELHSFYSDLYKEKNSEELISENCPFLNSGNIPKLSPAMR
ncbi:hypothetical protein ACROYT_G010478 [Oculina patagonica]